MDIELLTDEQFIRHVEALPLTNLEKSLLGRLKWKIDLLVEVHQDLEYLMDLVNNLKEELYK